MISVSRTGTTNRASTFANDLHSRTPTHTTHIRTRNPGSTPHT
jgi:hypothetical protein